MKLTPARLLVPAFLVAGLTLTGCSGADSDADSGSVSGGAARSSVDGEAPAAETADSAGDSALSTVRGVTGKGAEPVVAQEQALIRKGNVALRAKDVARAQIEVQKVVDAYAGQVTDQKTSADKDGTPTYARMVLRIPSKDFDKAIEDLQGAGTVDSVKTNQEDVTTEVIDVQTRLRVQKRSIARISVLFEQASNIRDIMAIESQLSQRQADLETLEQQAAYLDNQTSLSTIVVSVDQIQAKHATKEHEDEAGFLTGLSAGWGALSAFAVGLATAAGAVLPWLVVVAVVGVPTLLLVRSLRRRTPAAPVEAPQSSE